MALQYTFPPNKETKCYMPCGRAILVYSKKSFRMDKKMIMITMLAMFQVFVDGQVHSQCNSSVDVTQARSQGLSIELTTNQSEAQIQCQIDNTHFNGSLTIVATTCTNYTILGSCTMPPEMKCHSNKGYSIQLITNNTVLITFTKYDALSEILKTYHFLKCQHFMQEAIITTKIIWSVKKSPMPSKLNEVQCILFFIYVLLLVTAFVTSFVWLYRKMNLTSAADNARRENHIIHNRDSDEV